VAARKEAAQSLPKGTSDEPRGGGNVHKRRRAGAWAVAASSASASAPAVAADSASPLAGGSAAAPAVEVRRGARVRRCATDDWVDPWCELSRAGLVGNAVPDPQRSGHE